MTKTLIFLNVSKLIKKSLGGIQFDRKMSDDASFRIRYFRNNYFHLKLLFSNQF